MTAWGKLFARDLVDGVDWKVSNFRSYEDNFWTPQVTTAAERVALLSSELHFYRRNNGMVKSTTLGNRLTGNSKNGKPVGYLEYLELLKEFNQRITESKRINIDAELEELHYQRSWNRLCSLVDAQLLGQENNLEYVKDILATHQGKDWGLQQYNAELNGRLSKCETELNRLSGDLAKFNSTKHTTKRLIGNIKRRLLK
jgi:hypothetical protein